MNYTTTFDSVAVLWIIVYRPTQKAHAAILDHTLLGAGDPQAVGEALDAGPVAINPHWQINRKHVEIRGCWGCDYSHFHRSVQLLAHQGGQPLWLDAVSRRFPLEEANAALAAVANREVVKALIVPG